MIKHVVMWKFKQGEEENMNKFLEGLTKLKDKIDVIKDMQVGVNINEKNNYDAVLISEFESMEDLKIYKEDPRHGEVSKLCKSIREERGAVDFIF